MKISVIIIFIAFFVDAILSDKKHVDNYKAYMKIRNHCTNIECVNDPLNSLVQLDCVFKCINPRCFAEVVESKILESGSDIDKNKRRKKVFENCIRKEKRDQDVSLVY